MKQRYSKSRHPLVLAIWAVALSGCWLEKISGEPVPLDPRFYEAVEAEQGAPGVGGGASVPFGSYDGPTVTITGDITSPDPSPVEIDIRTPDPLAEGGVKGHGKIQVEAPGPYELTVPSNLGPLELQAFQDLDSDGPGGNDPFAQVSLVIEGEDLPGIRFELEPGARGSSGGPEHTEAAPGAPGGNPGGGPVHEDMPPAGDDNGLPPGEGGPDGAPASPGGIPPFVGLDGETVQVEGTLVWPGAPEGAVVDLDLFQASETAGGGRQMLGKLKVPLGEFSFSAPASFGPIILEAFIDIENNGPGQGDPMGRYEGNPISIGRRDISGILITLAVTTDGRMPGDTPPPPLDRPDGL